MTTQDIRIAKNALRKKYKQIRDDIQNKAEKEKAIFENLISSMSYKYCKKILTYSSLGSEVDTFCIIQKALDDGKDVYLPKSYSDGIMKFFKVTALDDLINGKFGIKEPDGTSEEYTPEGSDELILVPALCFDKSGYRIGYGKGYYDRFLSKFKGISAGLAFGECVCCESIVFEKRHDRRVDMIICDEGLKLIGDKKEV